MKTPMQELIDQMWEIAKYGDSYEVAPCIEAAEAMLEKEKESYCEFAEEYEGSCLIDYPKIEVIFNQTFKTKE